METKNTLRTRLNNLNTQHPLITARMRLVQKEAITNLEQSFADDRPRALIQIPTGTGKTYTAVSFV